MAPEFEGEIKKVDKKILAIFKGQEIEAGKLPEGAPIQFETPLLPKFDAQHGMQIPSRRIPRLLIAMSQQVSPYGPDTTRIEYMVHRTGGRGLLDLPKSFPVRVLTGRQGEVMSSKYQEVKVTKFMALYKSAGLYLGSDPEIFVENGKGELIPAFEFLPSKKNPVQVESGWGGVYWDGFQAEMSPQAAGCLANHGNAIWNTLKTIRREAISHNKHARLSTKTVVQISTDILAQAKPEHVAFGCAPSHNAYGLTVPNLDGRTTPFRFAGGHIHFGPSYSKPNLDEGAQITKALDLLLAIPCIPLFQTFDNPIRRQFYGLPGEFRLPSHGLEYRTLSNAWLIHPVLYHLVFEAARVAYNVGYSKLLGAFKYNESEVVDIIRESNVTGAKALLETNKAQFKTMWARPGPFSYSPDLVWNTFSNPLENLIAKPQDIEGNWLLKDAYNDQLHKITWGALYPRIVKGEKV